MDGLGDNNNTILLFYQNLQPITLPPFAFSRLLSSLVALPSLTRPNRRVDRDAAGGDRQTDDRGLSEPEPGRTAGPHHADAGGLRTGG